MNIAVRYLLGAMLVLPPVAGWAQKKVKMDTLVFYTDRECGFVCSSQYGYTQRYVNGVFKDSIELPCTINNKPISCERCRITKSSIDRMYKVGPFYCILYDLKGILVAKYGMQGAWGDTIGDYREYYPDGSLKVSGHFSTYTKEEADKLCYMCDKLPTFRHGYWEEYKWGGKLAKRNMYVKGKLVR